MLNLTSRINDETRHDLADALDQSTELTSQIVHPEGRDVDTRSGEWIDRVQLNLDREMLI